MKKLICIALVAVLLLALAACGGNTEEQTNGQPVDGTVSSGSDQTSAPVSDTTEPVDEEWGVYDTFSTIMNATPGQLNIAFPHLTGIPEGPGLIAYQNDASRVIVTGFKTGTSPDVSAPKEMLPAYCEQIDKIFAVNFGATYTDSSYTIDSSEMVTIGEYEMCKYTGVHSYSFEGKQWQCDYAAYATNLKSNGAPVMWLVQDESEDHSLVETVNEYAYKMAQSIWETEY